MLEADQRLADALVLEVLGGEALGEALGLDDAHLDQQLAERPRLRTNADGGEHGRAVQVVLRSGGDVIELGVHRYLDPWTMARGDERRGASAA